MTGVLQALTERQQAANLAQSLKVLHEAGFSEDIWSSGANVAEILLANYVRFEDPLLWIASNRGTINTYISTVTSLRETLAANQKICNLLEGIWSSRPDIAVHINSRALQALVEHMPTVHPKFVAGCAKYLTCTLPLKWDSTLADTSADSRVYSSVSMYIGAVRNLYLDAGHWHELWAAGKDVALCLIEHFLLHENQTGGKWSAEHVRNPEKYLNRNLQNIRDVVAANRTVVNVIAALKNARPDVALFLDGKALYRVASKLRTTQILVDFMAFLVNSLPEGWLDGAVAPQAEIHTCIDIYISHGWHLTGQAMASQSAQCAPSQHSHTRSSSLSGSLSPPRSAASSPPHSSRDSPTPPAFMPRDNRTTWPVDQGALEQPLVDQIGFGDLSSLDHRMFDQGFVPGSHLEALYAKQVMADPVVSSAGITTDLGLVNARLAEIVKQRLAEQGFGEQAGAGVVPGWLSQGGFGGQGLADFPAVPPTLPHTSLPPMNDLWATTFGTGNGLNLAGNFRGLVL